MSYSVFATDGFAKHVKSIAKKLIDSLAENPVQGDPLGKDCYKVRMAITSKGKGKSGGARIITCIKIVEHYVYLLTIYDKSDKETVSDKELDILLKLAGL